MSETSSNITNKISSSKFVKFCRQNFSKDMASLEATRKYYLIAIAAVIIITAIVFCLYMLYQISVIESKTAPQSVPDLDLLPPEMQMVYMSYNMKHLSVFNNVKYVMIPFVFLEAIAALAIPGGIIYVIIKLYKSKAKDIIFEKLLSYIGNFHSLNKKANILEKLLSYIGYLIGINLGNILGPNYFRDENYKHEQYIKNLNLFKKFNSYNCDDRIQGDYNSLKIDISEIELSYITKSKTSRHRSTSKTSLTFGSSGSEKSTIFKGIFIMLPCNKKFKGYTIIKKNFDNFGINQYTDAQKVNIEDPEFEKLYDVYSTDQIEARYLLTTAFINRMVELSKKGIGKNITVSFEQGNVNIAVASKKDWFEVPIIKKAKIEDFRAVITELALLLSIIDSLELDKNIGM